MGDSPSTILIVDDDRDIREMLAMALTLAGYEVVGMGDGAQALRYLRREAQSGLPAGLPSLIVLDLDMPVLSGAQFRAAQLADPRLAAIPVIVVSASTTITVAAAELKADAYMRKPVAIRPFLAAVRRWAPEASEPGGGSGSNWPQNGDEAGGPGHRV